MREESVGFRCLRCQGPTKVVETRSVGDRQRRRRQCLDCGGRVTTYEEVDMEATYQSWGKRIDAHLAEVMDEVLGRSRPDRREGRETAIAKLADQLEQIKWQLRQNSHRT